MVTSPLDPRTSAGDVLFARYAFPPNELGYCGPDDAAALLSHAAAGGGADIVARARRFDGAWPYLEVIATAAGIEDPLDPRVVEAYWVGNDLLDAVTPLGLLTALRARFVDQAGGCWVRITPEAGPLAHHSFQVFAVYPWLGLLDSGSPVPMSVLDRCRIRWGSVVAVDGDHATVSSQPLVWESGVLQLGPEREERVRWSAGGESLRSGITMGDCVSLHWDWVCDRLSEKQVGALRDVTASQIVLANRFR
jgi:Family of unknown function (DUF6390)